MVNQYDLLLDIVIASFLSGLVGLERGLNEKPAGFRTHMILGGSVALLVQMGQVIILRYQSINGLGQLQADPIRIIQAIIIGISFLGAGMVLQVKSEEKVKYLTSSATILLSAGIGLSVALKQYVIAVGITLLALFINYILRMIIKWIRNYFLNKKN